MTTKDIFLILTFTVFYQSTFAQQTKYDKVISEFIQSVKENKVETIAKKTAYPFYRTYPIPSIHSAKEFISRYNQIFDDSLKQLIVLSNIHKDWSSVGWRGIMLLNGVLWLDTDGGLEGVNYQSDFEKKEWKQLVDIEKSKLYPSIRKFKSPDLFMVTKDFKIRIDDLGDGNYRYASWPIYKTQSDKPDLILTNGKIEFQGSGGNHDYIFKKGDYAYVCYIAILREEDSPPAWVTVLKNKREILKESALKIDGR